MEFSNTQRARAALSGWTERRNNILCVCAQYKNPQCVPLKEKCEKNTPRISLCATYQRHVPQIQACCLFIYLSDRTNQRFYFNSICWNCFRAFISGQIFIAAVEWGIHLLSWRLLFPVSQRSIACSTLNNPSRLSASRFVSVTVCWSLKYIYKKKFANTCGGKSSDWEKASCLRRTTLTWGACNLFVFINCTFNGCGWCAASLRTWDNAAVVMNPASEWFRKPIWATPGFCRLFTPSNHDVDVVWSAGGQRSGVQAA